MEMLAFFGGLLQTEEARSPAALIDASVWPTQVFLGSQAYRGNVPDRTDRAFSALSASSACYEMVAAEAGREGLAGGPIPGHLYRLRCADHPSQAHTHPGATGQCDTSKDRAPA
jgi:hypothetical protein